MPAADSLRLTCLAVCFAFTSIACSEPSSADEPPGADTSIAGAAGSGGSAVGSGGAGSGGASSSSTGGASANDAPDCEGIDRNVATTPSGEDLCDVYDAADEKCGREQRWPECRDKDVSHYDGCYVTLLAEEFEKCREGADDRDASIAMLRANPGVAAPEALECLEQGGSNCDGEPLGRLKACIDRAEACDLGSDTCFGVFLMQPVVKTTLLDCIALPCDEIDGCVSAALGTAP